MGGLPQLGAQSRHRVTEDKEMLTKILHNFLNKIIAINRTWSCVVRVLCRFALAHVPDTSSNTKLIFSTLCVIALLDRHALSTSLQMKVTKMLLFVSTVFVLLNLPSYVFRLMVFVMVIYCCFRYYYNNCRRFNQDFYVCVLKRSKQHCFFLYLG